VLWRGAVTLVCVLPLILPALVTGTEGDGLDGVCDGRLPARFERQILVGQQFREAHGLPTDPAYVETVLRAPDSRRLSTEEPYLVSPAERRYLADRQVVQDHIYHVTEYVRKYARDVDGGISIEDDFPAGAYVAVRLTRDLEKHAAVLSKVPERVRVIGVRFTEREIQRQADRFTPRVFRSLRRRGIDVVSVGDDIARNGVDAEVISRRPDAAAAVEGFFASGPPVRATVIGKRPYRRVCVRAGRYRPDRTGKALRVTWSTYADYRRPRVKAYESKRAVRIEVRESAPNGPMTLLGAGRSAVVRLKAPLANRKVVDAESGRTLRRSKK
jgi:hypothetical protein